MINFKTHLLITLLLCFSFISFPWGQAKSETSVVNPLSTWELIKKSRMKQAESAGPVRAERVLHFPKEQSLGQLMVQDSNT